MKVSWLRVYSFIGCLTDYYIALGVNYLGQQEFAQKRFFWCTGESLQFTELPKSLGSTCRPLYDQIQCGFTGEFDKVIIQHNGSSQYVFADKELLAKVRIPERGITELDRLSHVVNQIDSDCHIVPKGSLKKTPLKETRINEAFRGLKADETFQIENYYHFRAPMHKHKVELNKRSEGIYNHDFMDNASEDVPNGVWSVLKDTMGQVSVIRNKLWPGFYAFHKSNSNVYGCFYMGNGVKNLDLPFMY